MTTPDPPRSYAPTWPTVSGQTAPSPVSSSTNCGAPTPSGGTARPRPCRLCDVGVSVAVVTGRSGDGGGAARPGGALFEVIDRDDLWFRNEKAGIPNRKAQRTASCSKEHSNPEALSGCGPGSRRRESRSSWARCPRAGVQVGNSGTGTRGICPSAPLATDAQARGHFLEPAIADWWGRSTPRQGGTHRHVGTP